MTELMLAGDACERVGCRVRIRRTDRTAVLVFLGNRHSGGVTDTVKVYCSHRCEALARP